MIPVLDLKAQYQGIREEINSAVRGVMESGSFILGPNVRALEQEVAEYCGCGYGVGMASGTDALRLAIDVLEIGPGDEVITTPFTFVASANTISRAGATPVFVDIDPDTFNIDPFQAEKAITRNTVGILPVHLYGLSCNMEAIKKIARKKGLFILEDAAQAFGATFKKSKLGTIGALGAFSFFPSKNLGAYGDAGLIVTNNAKLARLAKVLRNHGQTTPYNASFLGYNSRLDSIQATTLLVKLKYLDKFNRARRNIACGYNKKLKGVSGVKTPLEPQGYSHAFYLYTLRVPYPIRDSLCAYLNRKGIEARIYYSTPLYEMKAFKNAKKKGTFKNTKKISSEVISLPLHPFLKEEEINYVTNEVSRFLKRGR